MRDIDEIIAKRRVFEHPTDSDKWRAIEALLGTVDNAAAIDDEAALPDFCAEKLAKVIAALEAREKKLADALRLLVFDYRLAAVHLPSAEAALGRV